MRLPHLGRPGLLLSLALVAVTLCGCIERSVVVKVKKDGSGIVHLRNHRQSETISFIKNDSDEAKHELSQTQIDQFTAALGPGVRLASVKATTNRGGWPGQDVIWEFDDINQLVLSLSVLGGDDFDEENAKEDGGFRFSMKGGELQIRPFDERRKNAEKENDVDGAVDPFANKPSAPGLGDLVTQQLMAKALADFRLGAYIQMEGEIESSNAKHRQANLITLLNIELGELLENPNAKADLGKLSKQGKSMSAMGEMADQIEGISVDFQNPIRVKMR